jgi:hypothetical protein
LTDFCGFKDIQNEKHQQNLSDKMISLIFAAEKG